MRSMRILVAMLAALGMTALVAAPASAQQQEGLVNVNVSDVQVGLPIGLAANVCDVNANILAEQVRTGDAVCNARADSEATFGKGSGNGSPRQEGLVNVNVSDVTIKVPIAIAANICDVNVNALARQIRTGDTDCEAVANATT